MEEGLVIGYDLCSDYCRISIYREGNQEPEDFAFSGEENPYLIQNSICKKKGENQWLIGQEAYEAALLGGGVITDKILRLVAKEGTSTFEGVCYSAEELLQHFLEETLSLIYQKYGTNQVAQLMFSLQELDEKVLDSVIRCTKRLGLSRERVHIISHAESFLFFVLSQRREMWSNLSVLYDLSGVGLNYYQLNVLRGVQPNVVKADRQFLEEGFSLEILEQESGQKLADSIMTSCVTRMLDRKLISSVYLSGRGMDHCQEWGQKFLPVLCNRRKVFFIQNLFSKGAVYAACDYLRKNSSYPYVILCEGRIKIDIYLECFQGLLKKNLVLAEAGSNWYDTKREFDLILDQQNSLLLKVRKLGERNAQPIEIPLDTIPVRKNKTTRIGVSLSFTSENTFSVKVRDKGFGEFYPASDTVILREYTVE